MIEAFEGLITVINEEPLATEDEVDLMEAGLTSRRSTGLAAMYDLEQAARRESVDSVSSEEDDHSDHSDDHATYKDALEGLKLMNQGR